MLNAKKYANFSGDVEVNVEENGKGSDYGFYSISLLEKKTNVEVNMDITKKGGYPIWYLNNRDVNKSKILI